MLRSLCRDFHLHFQVLWLTPHWFNVAAWKFCWKKKQFSRRVLAHTARFLGISSLETLRFLALEGMTNFGTALAKHCNHVFCSSVPQIDCLKPFLADYSIACGVNGLASVTCFWCGTTIVAIGRKVRFQHTLPFMTKQRVAVRLGYLLTRDGQIILLGVHFEGRVNGGPYLLMEVEASFDL